jgi:hypothetical protein
VWTPKRVLILVGGFFAFSASYAVYSYFLGGINGLPPLPPEMLASKDQGAPLPEGDLDERDRRLVQAFGPGCEELRRPLRLLLREKGMVLASGAMDLLIPRPGDTEQVQVTGEECDGRVKLSPFSIAMFPKSKGEGFPEINTIQCESAYLTLDRPISNFTELGSRKVIAVELRGRDIVLINNRHTPQKNDDLEVQITNGPLFYEEARDLIWSDGFVHLLDTQTQPNPTKITAKGLELKLSKDTTPNRPKEASGKGKGEGPAGVELLVLRSYVNMYLWVDPSSGFLAGPEDLGKKSGPAPVRGEKPAAPEKALIFITTHGPFTYDPREQLAWFDTPTRKDDEAPTAPDEVTVLRKHKVGPQGEKNDHLVCRHLKLKFRPKPAGATTAPRDASTGDKEIEWVLATCRKDKDVVLTMDTESLEAYGSELYYEAATGERGSQTILKGSPMRAVKEGHKIVAQELRLLGSKDKSNMGQKAIAKGPGRIDLFERGNLKNQYPVHALWNDLLTSVKEREGDQVLDLLTLTGAASFVDVERQQRLHGEKLQVWMHQNQASADVPAPAGAVQADNAAKQKLHRVIATEKVRAITPEMLIRRTNRLTITFLPEVAADDRLPDVAAVTTARRPTAETKRVELAPPVEMKETPPQAIPIIPAPVEKKKEEKPLQLVADEVVMYVSTLGTKKQLQEMKAEGNVYVVQEGDLPGEKKVEIQGQLLNLLHHPLGDTLFVYGESGKWGRLDLGQLKLAGPKIVVNQKDNIAEVEGQGAMNMPSNRNFDGTAAPAEPGKTETRMTIHWNKNMIFRGKDAEFYGGVQADQDNSRLLCQDLYVTLDRYVSLKEGQSGGKGASVDHILCDRKVFVIDQKLEPGKPLQASIIEGSYLDSYNKDGPTNVRGPGRVRHLAVSGSDLGVPGRPGEPAPKSAAPRQELTIIEFAGNMISNNRPGTKNATFLDNIHVQHFPAETLDAVMNPDRPPKNGFYMQCEKLRVEARTQENKTTQLMVAEKKVFFRNDEFYGHSDVLKFDEAQDHIIFEANEGNMVQLFKQAVQGQRAAPITGKKILYNRRDGTFQVEKGSVFQSSRLEGPAQSPWQGCTRIASISRSRG